MEGSDWRPTHFEITLTWSSNPRSSILKLPLAPAAHHCIPANMDVPLPTDEQDFGTDERISFSKLDNKFIAVQDDGTELEFDAELKQWVPAALDDDDVLEYGGEAAVSDLKRKNGSEVGLRASYTVFGEVS